MEVIVSMAIVVLVAVAALGIGIDTYKRSNVDIEQNTLIALLHRARSRALNNIDESVHGIYVDSSGRRYILFKGGAYSPGNPENEITLMRGDEVSISGLVDTEIIFGQLDGGASNTGNIHISDGSLSKDIDINSEGGILWN